MTQGELFKPKPQILRDYQEKMVEGSLRFVAATLDSTDAHNTLLIASPTGSGKGTAQLALLKRLLEKELDAWILTPSLEIIRGFLERMGVDCSGLTDYMIVKKAWERGISTHERFVNRLLKGEIDVPDVIIVDEAHEWVLKNKTPKALMALLAGAVKIGFTATPYRATPRATMDLRGLWGEPQVALTIRQAVEGGYMALPEFSIIPICNDDTVKIGSGGELQPKAVSNRYKSNIERACDLVERYYDHHYRMFDKGTIVSCPSTTIIDLMVERLTQKGVPVYGVTQKTPASIRAEAYREGQACRAVILQIGVLTRGADLPGMRRLIDMQPTMSPVRWMQTIGRVCRPGEVPSEVIVTNRNLARHYYLLEGLIPRSVVVSDQVAFGGASTRVGARELGFEALGRLKRIAVPLAGGGEATLFNVCRSDKKGRIEQYAVIIPPGSLKPLVAMQEKRYNPDDPSPLREITYSGWRRAELPEDFEGFATDVNAKRISDKQRTWWKRAAERKGLDPEAADKLKARQFVVLPILKDLALRIS